MPDFRWVHIASLDELEQFYASIIPTIRTAARDHGYAIGLHGSMRRDLDLIAAPWTEEAPADPNVIARAVHLAACGLEQTAYRWSHKPCGRLATSMPICWIDFEYDRSSLLSMGHVDLSVMPRT